MNVYEFDIWRSVKHNGEFSHNVPRTQLVHALNEAKARERIILAQGKAWANGLTTIETSSEFIYSTRKTGTVTKQMFYVYSDGRTPRPVK